MKFNVVKVGRGVQKKGILRLDTNRESSECFVVLLGHAEKLTSSFILPIVLKETGMEFCHKFVEL
jgi:hypothetical protein